MKYKLLLLAMGLALTPQMIMAQMPSYLPTNGLEGYWTFNNNANDESGNGHNGVVNGATLTADRYGNPNSAYSFNGINNYIQTNYPGVLGNNFRTISFWAKSNSSSEMASFSYGASTGTGNRFDGYFNFNGIGCTANIAGGSVTYSAPSQVNDNNWHNYIYVVDQLNSQANSIKIYQDGILLTNIINNYNPNTAINTANEIGLRFGKTTYPGIPSNFNGTLDDIGFWNRALTQQEITNLYNSLSVNECLTMVINTGVLSTTPVTYTSTVNIYPNPANDQITIDCGNLTNVVGWNIKITNMLGQEVFNQPMNTQQYVVPLNSWTGQGMYFVKIINAQNEVVNIKKIILQ
jgi:hypothetical protein